MVKINGEDVNCGGQTINQVLSAGNYNLQRVAVERNGKIVPKAEYSSCVLNDGDELEVVRFVGGG